MKECPELEEYVSGDIEQILLTHGSNAETSGICRARHNALVKRLKEFMNRGTQ